jgi:glycosyltransferase involved in cell wall biosynthesis
LFVAAERLERLVYERADAIATTNDAFRSWIAERSPAGTRIEVVPNGTSNDWLQVGETEVSRSSVGLPEERFVWAYAGNVGLAHGLEVAADSARLLGEEYLLLVIGEGPRRVALEQRAAQAPSTVDLRGLMPAARAASHLRAADAVLVSERQQMVVSSKLYDACAVGRPVIAACQGELRRIVELEEIALAVPHGDAEALAGAVRRLRSEPELRQRLSDRAREFARRHLRERQAQRLAELCESLPAPR